MINASQIFSSPTKKLSESQNNPSLSYPSPKKTNHLIKPDFSPILFHENNFFAKSKGSYKIQKKFAPDSPVKTPNTDYLTPIKVQGKDLFGIKNDRKCCRKLNFDDFEEKDFSKKETNNNTENDFLQLIKDDKIINQNIYNENGLENNNNIKDKECEESKECNDRMEKDFIIIKTLTNYKFDAIYQVKEKKTNKIYCIKKISEKTKKNNFNLLPQILSDIQKESNNTNLELGHSFCIKIIDYWLEKQNFYLKEKNRNYFEKNIYILTDFYSSGDILDYLEKLEKINYRFTSNFYWDLIFEMMIGLLYFHNKGYIHFDIKPTNYLVNNEGYILLNDFGLSHKIEELSNLDDIIEGDSKYISKELFECIDKISLRNINYKTDIFSLGLSLLEILAKIDLPNNGKLWRYIRDSGGRVLNEKFFVNSNISNNIDFINLIKKMISPVNERPDLIELINDTGELKKRYLLLKKNEYKKENIFI